MAIFLSIIIVLLLVLAAAAWFYVVKQKPGVPSLGAENSVLNSLTESLKDISSIKAQVENLSQVQNNFVQNQNTLQKSVSQLETGLRGVETKVVETSGSVRDSLTKDLNEARRSIDTFKAEYQGRKRFDEEMQLSTKRIEAVILGSRSRGESGENILSEAFKLFPAGMIDYNFKVKGKPVEYALILANQKRLPIDSKWVAEDLLAKLSEETDITKKKAIEDDIERAILRKIKEVTQYIDPITTTPQAIAAVPDAVFSACRKAHVEAYKDRVILMPYSMTIPYVLALYNLNQQYSRSLNMDNLESHLSQLEKHVDSIDKALENSVARGATMINNAYSECKKYVGEIKGSLAYLKALPEQQNLPAADTTPKILEMFSNKS